MSLNYRYQITISGFLPDLEFHLLTTTLGQVVIFYEITGFLRAVFRRLSQWITSYTLKVSMYNDPQKEGKPER